MPPSAAAPLVPPAAGPPLAAAVAEAAPPARVLTGTSSLLLLLSPVLLVECVLAVVTLPWELPVRLVPWELPRLDLLLSPWLCLLLFPDEAKDMFARDPSEKVSLPIPRDGDDDDVVVTLDVVPSVR